MSSAEFYLRDLGALLKKKALDAKRERSTVSEDAFSEGKLLAYNEVLSLMLAQARAFGIHPDALGLAGFDPDKEL